MNLRRLSSRVGPLERTLGTGGLSLVALVLLGAILGNAIRPRGVDAVHLQIEYFAVFAAVSIFFLSSAKFTVSRERYYLPLSLGFLGVALFDLFHPLVPSGDLPVETLGVEFLYRDLDGYLWWFGRIAFGAAFLWAGLAYRRGRLDPEPGRSLLVGLLITLGSALGALVVLALVPVPAFYGPDGQSAWLELLPVVLYAYALVLVVPSQVQLSPGTRAVAGASLGSAIATQLVAAFASAPGDAFFFAAHGLKVLSYLAVLFGLFLEHVQLYAGERQLRQALERSEAKARELTEGAPDAIVEMGDDGRISFFNRAAERLFGYAKDEVLGQDVAMLMPKPMRPIHTQARERYFRTGESRLKGRTLELPALRKDGQEIVVELTLSYAEGPQGRRVTAILRDVQVMQRSRRERAGLLAVAQSVNETPDAQTLVSHSVVGLKFALGYESVALLLRDSASSRLRLAGLSGPDENLRAAWSDLDLGAPEASAPLEAYRTRAPVALAGAGDARPPSSDDRLALRAESLLLAVPVFVGPEVVGVLAGLTTSRRHTVDEEVPLLESVAFELALGISQKRLLEELRDTARSLELANRELDAFVYTASHDLAEPLRSLTNFSKFLLEDHLERLNPDGQDYVRRIHDAATRMRALLEALLQLSRIRHKPLAMESVDPARVLREVRESLDAMLRDRKAELVVQEPLPRIRAQPTRLFEVFSNLISNGLKFNESPRPRVEVQAASREGRVEFSVRDNGIGIPKGSEERMFGLFTRLHPKERYPGTGAGLAIVRTIVEQHGGKIWVESEKGHGTIVRFTMPRDPTESK